MSLVLLIPYALDNLFFTVKVNDLPLPLFLFFKVFNVNFKYVCILIIIESSLRGKQKLRISRNRHQACYLVNAIFVCGINICIKSYFSKGSPVVDAS